MKTTKETRQKIADLIRTYLTARFPAVLEAIRSNPEKVSTAELWTLWHHVTDEIRHPDGSPRYESRKRVLPHDFNFSIYPDGTNDVTLETGLKAAVKLI